MTKTLALRAGIVSAVAAAVLGAGIFVFGLTAANAQTPDPTPAPQQTQPATPGQGTPGQDDGAGGHKDGDCPRMSGDDSSGSGSSSSSGTSFRGARGGSHTLVYRQ